MWDASARFCEALDALTAARAGTALPSRISMARYQGRETMCDQDHFDDDKNAYEALGHVTRRQFGV
jgi:hypothetical protein